MAGTKNKGKINKEWHIAHRMPKKASLDQRIEWHIAHAMNCNCREMPRSIRLEIEKRKIS